MCKGWREQCDAGCSDDQKLHSYSLCAS
jgi:hypothetical protein